MKTANAALLLALSLPLAAQKTPLSASSTLWKGVSIEFETRVEPPGTPLPGAVLPRAGRVHVFVTDAVNQRYFGYDVTMEPLGDSPMFQLKLGPLTLSATDARSYNIGAGYTLLAPARYPDFPPLRAGQTAAVDLLVNPSTGQKIVSYLTLRDHSSERPPAVAARDFGLADTELSINRPRLSINGKPVDDTAGFEGGINGHFVWFYLEGRGRFVFSLFPNAAHGLKQGGIIAGQTLTFTDGADEYRLECSRSIAPGTGPFHLYVSHEAGWRPQGSNTPQPFFLGASDNDAWIK